MLTGFAIISRDGPRNLWQVKCSSLLPLPAAAPAPHAWVGRRRGRGGDIVAPRAAVQVRDAAWRRRAPAGGARSHRFVRLRPHANRGWRVGNCWRPVSVVSGQQGPQHPRVFIRQSDRRDVRPAARPLFDPAHPGAACITAAFGHLDHGTGAVNQQRACSRLRMATGRVPRAERPCCAISGGAGWPHRFWRWATVRWASGPRPVRCGPRLARRAAGVSQLSNVLDKLPKRLQPRAKRALHEMIGATPFRWTVLGLRLSLLFAEFFRN